MATLPQIKNGTDAQINTKVAAVASALSAAYNVGVV